MIVNWDRKFRKSRQMESLGVGIGREGHINMLIISGEFIFEVYKWKVWLQCTSAFHQL